MRKERFNYWCNINLQLDLDGIANDLEDILNDKISSETENPITCYNGNISVKILGIFHPADRLWEYPIDPLNRTLLEQHSADCEGIYRESGLDPKLGDSLRDYGAIFGTGQGFSDWRGEAGAVLNGIGKLVNYPLESYHYVKGMVNDIRSNSGTNSIVEARLKKVISSISGQLERSPSDYNRALRAQQLILRMWPTSFPETVVARWRQKRSQQMAFSTMKRMKEKNQKNALIVCGMGHQYEVMEFFRNPTAMEIPVAYNLYKKG